MKLFAQITKVDQANRLVYGVLAAEQPDRSGEILDYATSKAHFQAWSEEVAKDTDGKSLGNVRAMHGKVAAGKLVEFLCDDATKTVQGCAKVVDDAEWKKVEEGVYTGFSIGGKYIKKWADANLTKGDGKTPLERYTAAPSEVSLVDRPCIPAAKFFEIKKADGSTEQKAFVEKTTDELLTAFDELMKAEGDLEAMAQEQFSDEQLATIAEAAKGELPPWMASKKKKKEEGKDEKAEAKEEKGEKADAPPEYEVSGTDEELATLAKLMGENKFTVGSVIDIIKASLVPTPATAESMQKMEGAGELKKSFWLLNDLVSVTERMRSVFSQSAFEEMAESDTASQVPRKAKAIFELLCELVRDMAIEETGEMLAEAGKQVMLNPTPALALMAKSEFFEPLRALKKSESPVDYGGALHKLATEWGAKCGAEKQQPAVDLSKLDAGSLQKMIADEVAKATGAAKETIEKLEKKVSVLEAQPVAPKAVLKVVSKQDDDLSKSQRESQQEDVQPVLNKDGSVNEAATLIKFQHAHRAVAYVDADKVQQ